MGKTQQQSATEYDVRPYQSADRDRFLSLYETVWGRQKGVDWFEWRFETNPYRDGVQMVVAEQGEDLVGAEPLLPFRLRIGDSCHDVYQPVDWIVHPDHRRRGLFTRMTEAVLDRHLPEVSLLFNFPNSLLRPGLEKFDWQTVGHLTCRYRVQNSRVLANGEQSEHHPVAASIAARLGPPVVRAGLGVLDRLAAPTTDVTVERSTGVPVDTIHDLYRSTRPDSVHVPRDRPFLRWRFANPNWETMSYVAAREGKPVASITTGTEVLDHCRLTHLLDIQPMATEPARPNAFGALLAAVVEDSHESDLLRAPSGLYPAVFRRYGFVRDDTFPLSIVSTETTHAIRTGESTAIGTGVDLTSPAAWKLTLGDLDIE